MRLRIFLIVLFCVILAGMTLYGRSKSDMSLAPAPLQPFPYCKPVQGTWPAQSIVTASGNENRYIFEVCLLGTEGPKWGSATGGKNVRMTGGPGYARLREASTGKVLAEEAFPKLDTDASVFWDFDGNVSFTNAGEEIGFSPSKADFSSSKAF